MAEKEEFKGTLVPLKKPKEYMIISKFVNWMLQSDRIGSKMYHKLEEYVDKYAQLVNEGEIINGY